MSGFLSNKNPREGKMIGDFQDIIYWVNELITFFSSDITVCEFAFLLIKFRITLKICFFQLVSDVLIGKFFLT